MRCRRWPSSCGGELVLCRFKPACLAAAATRECLLPSNYSDAVVDSLQLMFVAQPLPPACSRHLEPGRVTPEGRVDPAWLLQGGLPQGPVVREGLREYQVSCNSFSLCSSLDFATALFVTATAWVRMQRRARCRCCPWLPRPAGGDG